MTIKRGWVYLADLNPRKGTEPGKVRPVLVIQTDLLNNTHPSTIILPITTNVQHHAKYLRVHLAKNEGGLDAESD
ncbi:MAG: type II toxin-antitoxin system PemK/MazF family toxin, partial [Elusimicrobia bacterium]|nr:type II toxin-antitoxin system PemK/MazF family toxin [Elusimicrobiota bacterium]